MSESWHPSHDPKVEATPLLPGLRGADFQNVPIKEAQFSPRAVDIHLNARRLELMEALQIQDVGLFESLERDAFVFLQEITSDKITPNEAEGFVLELLQFMRGG